MEPSGLSSPEEVVAQRQDHITRLYRLFKTTDIFIYTLGLTEYWIAQPSGLAYPTCPGVVAGEYCADKHALHNASYLEVQGELVDAFSGLKFLNPKMKLLLTVSPVPLTATAYGGHVLSATTYSKSTLRAVAGDLAAKHENIDYFPSYELITGAPFQGRFFEPNLRQVTQPGIDLVMSVFFGAHKELIHTAPVTNAMTSAKTDLGEDDTACEDLLLDAFLK